MKNEKSSTQGQLHHSRGAFASTLPQGDTTFVPPGLALPLGVGDEAANTTSAPVTQGSANHPSCDPRQPSRVSVRPQLEYLEAKRARFKDLNPEFFHPDNLLDFIEQYGMDRLFPADESWDGPLLGTAVGFVEGVAFALQMSVEELLEAEGYNWQEHEFTPPLPLDNDSRWG